MAKSKKSTKKSSRRSVRVQDLRPKKNPKGGVEIKFTPNTKFNPLNQ